MRLRERLQQVAQERGVPLARYFNPKSPRGKQRRVRRPMKDEQTGVIYWGFGAYPANFKMSRAVPL
jgi:hypothetical protein